MLFLGNSFLSGKYSADITPTFIENVTTVTITNSICGDLFISKNPHRNLADKAWTFDTVLHAEFNGNLLAGNVDFTASTITSILIKRRLKNTNNDWITLYEIPINGDKAKFTFERFDRTISANKDYEYALIPMINAVEGNYNINSIIPQFEGIFILTKDTIYNAVLDVDIQIQRNKPYGIVSTIDNKYPYVITNSKNNYSSGTVSATFIEEDYANNEWKVKQGYDYRENLLDFLFDGYPKLIKNDTGETWLVMITDNISETRTQYTDKVTTQFQFTEVGDSKNPLDLYEADLLDFDVTKYIKR